MYSINSRLLLIFGSSLMMVVTSYLYGETKDDKSKYEAEIVVPQGQCLQLLSTNRFGANSWQLTFFNACGKRVYANACVEERPGKFKLHKSGGRIPEMGYWKLFSYEGNRPLSVNVTTASGQPAIPGQCTG